GVPGDVRARQVFVEVHETELTLVARFDVHLPVPQRHAFKPGVDGKLRVLPLFLLDHAGRDDALPMDGPGVAGALGADGRARLARRGEGIEVGGDPVLKYLRERPLDFAPRQFFGMPESVLAQSLLILAAEDLDRAVVVDGAEDVIELD